MKKTSILLPLAVLAGCATSTTPNYDANFGSSVREARLKMTINPDAGKRPDLVLGLDGTAARESMIRYYDSFKTPPPVINAINIGGRIGSAAGAGQGQ
jgi:hypothetical protein